MAIERWIYNTRIANIEVNDKDCRRYKVMQKEEVSCNPKVMDIVCKIRKSIV
jgi:hypothetical protein